MYKKNKQTGLYFENFFWVISEALFQAKNNYEEISEKKHPYNYHK
jgi:hypothetical protein